MSSALATADDRDVSTHNVQTPARRRGIVHTVATRWRVIAVLALVVASMAITALIYFGQYRIDHQTSDAAAAAAIDSAREGSIALLSYAPQSLDHDLAAAKANLTGDFLTYFAKFTDQIVAPAVKQNGVTASATVARAAVVELRPDSAKVLIFLNQITVSRDRPDPSQTAGSVVVSLTKVNDRWLISAFDPV